jgi:hypothetical protein
MVSNSKVRAFFEGIRRQLYNGTRKPGVTFLRVGAADGIKPSEFGNGMLGIGMGMSCISREDSVTQIREVQTRREQGQEPSQRPKA